nr:protein BCCIP homolog [Ipomoea batatas]
MPRKLTRHRRLLRYKPFGFSPFARSIAQLASDNKVKRKIYNGLQEKKFPSSSGNGVLNHTQGSKIQHSDSSDDEFEGTVQADFEFFDPKPDDFHGVKVLLQTYLNNNKQWDLSGFVDLILGQPTVGTVVKIANDEDEGIYSVISALNLGRYKASNIFLLSYFFIHCIQ